MSFRDNLQHLRATRNMTQEQLAMLLGVSRQSVTKWEAERSYPEMDKLLKLCRIFDCTLDDLVQGDLTGRAPEPARAVPANVAPQDVCGYDEHRRKMARRIPAGVAVIIAAIGASCLMAGVLGISEDGAGTMLAVGALAGVLAGLAFLVPAGMEHSAFVKAHPYIEDFYTEDDRVRVRTAFARGLIGGIGLIFAGVAVWIAAGEDPARELLALGVLLLCVAAGAWLIVRYSMLLAGLNIAEYNKNVADELEMEDIVRAQVDQDVKDSLLYRKAQSKKVGAVCGIIMLVATMVGLALLFVPVGDPATWASGEFHPEGTTVMWFWLAWPIGGMLCGVTALLFEAFGKKG